MYKVTDNLNGIAWEGNTMTEAAGARRAYVLGIYTRIRSRQFLHTAAYQVLKENIAYARRDTLSADLPALMDEQRPEKQSAGFRSQCRSRPILFGIFTQQPLWPGDWGG